MQSVKLYQFLESAVLPKKLEEFSQLVPFPITYGLCYDIFESS